MIKKTLSYFIYILSFTFIIRYLFQFFPDLIWALSAKDEISSILLKLLGLLINFSFVFILFKYAKELIRNQIVVTKTARPISLIKKILGYILFLIGIMFSVSILGNIYLYFRMGFPNTFMGIVNNILLTIVFLVIVIECFKYGRKWTKKEQPISIEIDDICQE